MQTERRTTLSSSLLVALTLTIFGSQCSPQVCQKKTVGNRTTCANPGGACSISGGSGVCKTDADVGCACNVTKVLPPAYALGFSVFSEPTIPAGSSATSVIQVTPSNGYTGAVTLSCGVSGGNPPLPACQLNPNVVNVNVNATLNSTLTFSTSNQSSPATYTVTLSAVDAHGTHASNGAPSRTVAVAAPQPLRGFVELHAHPLANIGFGGKLFYGGVDQGSLLPADPDCNANVRASGPAQALGHDKSTHGGHDFTSNPCGDEIRKAVVATLQTGLGGADVSEDAHGYPDFTEWPVWNDLTHQKMWVDWIQRAYTAGLRVMVALAVNNKTLGDMTAGPGDYPTDDKTSADSQIAEIKSFVARHSDFMEVAYASTDVYRIVSANKLAVIIGIEVDHIGNLQAAQNPAVPSDTDIKAEIDRLYSEGVRYIFPIHVLDNAFGGSAAYVNLFNVSNVRESGHSYALICADPNTDNISYTYDNSDLTIKNLAAQLLKTGWSVNSISYPACPSAGQPQHGQKNSLALTPGGVVAIKEMMRLGMLIDIDHMSQAAADEALRLACYGEVASGRPFKQPCPLNYPLNSGHNGLRGEFGVGSQNERALRAEHYAAVGSLHGMAGVGSGGLDAYQWVQAYSAVINAMGPNAVAGFGTDTDGFALGMPPSSPQFVTNTNPKYPACVVQAEQGNCTGDLTPAQLAACQTKAQSDCKTQYPDIVTCTKNCGRPLIQYTASFTRSTLGTQTWDYNHDGVAHYGMLADFLQDLKNVPAAAAPNALSGPNVIDNLMLGADYLYQTWKLCESGKAKVPAN